jgi:hypothetical protein
MRQQVILDLGNDFGRVYQGEDVEDICDGNSNIALLLEDQC